VDPDSDEFVSWLNRQLEVLDDKAQRKRLRTQHYEKIDAAKKEKK